VDVSTATKTKKGKMSAPRQGENKSWLDLLIDGTEENESPERYFYWAGLAAISAVVRKNVFIDRFFYKLYPNIYVALVSSRSGLKKGIPISIVKGILEECALTRIISGCNSIQGLIKELSMQRTFENGNVLSEAQGIMLSDEFESFLTDDPKALTYLTALHNTHEHEKSWTKNIKSSPIEELKSPCLTLLIASNEALFDSIVKQKDIEGGFIARTFIVHESQVKLINPLVKPPKVKLDSHELAMQLTKISKIKGEFKWTPDAGDMYTEWYTKLSHNQSDDRTGTLGRLGDQVLKVAMLISLSRKESLDITTEDLSMSIRNCESCMPAVNVVTLSGKSEVGDAISRVLKVLITSPNQEISRSKILARLHSYGVDSMVLDRVMESLIQADAIHQPFRNSKKEVMYRMKKETYEKYIKFKKEES